MLPVQNLISITYCLLITKLSIEANRVHKHVKLGKYPGRNHLLVTHSCQLLLCTAAVYFLLKVFFFGIFGEDLKLVSIFATFVDQDYIGNCISYSDWERPQTNRWDEHFANLNSSNGLQIKVV